MATIVAAPAATSPSHPDLADLKQSTVTASTSAVSSLSTGTGSDSESAVLYPNHRLAAAIDETSRPHKDWPNDIGFNAAYEQRTPRQLHVTGQFPSYACGTIIRTGPGISSIKRTAGGKLTNNDPVQVHHWFDGMSMLYKFDIKSEDSSSSLSHGPTVSFTSRCQVDEGLEEASRNGKLDGISFAQKRDPCDTLYKKLKTVWEPRTFREPGKANIAVTVSKITPKGSGPNVMTSLTDTASTKQFDLNTLEPLGVTHQEVLHPELKGPLSCAHAEYDPENGDLFNYNLNFGRNATYKVFKVDAKTRETTILATIASSDIKAAYIHSFFLTANFVVLCVWPSFFTKYGMSVLYKRNILESMRFDPDAKAQWIVVDRRHGRGVVARYTSPAFFCFHTTNAFEEPASDGKTVDLVCEGCVFEDMDIMNKFWYNGMMSRSKGAVSSVDSNGNSRWKSLKLPRYRLAGVPLSASLAAGPVKNVPLRLTTKDQDLEVTGDLPTFNPLFATRPHRYVYLLVDRGLSTFMDGIGKCDTKTGEIIYWSTPKHTPGEAIFVPNPAVPATPENEDNGVLLTVVLDGEKSTSYLLCLDARTLKEIARAEVGMPVSFGLHGIHMPSSSK